MKTGDLVMLAEWCKNGGSLRPGLEISPPPIQAIYLNGPLAGKITGVFKGNLFSVYEYHEAMRKRATSR